MISNLDFTKKSLLAVQGPTQFIAAYISLLWYEKDIFKSETQATLLVYDTSVPLENELHFFDSIKKLAALHQWCEVIFINQVEMKEISFNRYSTCIKTLKLKLLQLEFDNIFIARDFGSFGTELILDAYPSALRIEYGDSFGLVGNKKSLNFSLGDFVNSPLVFTKAIIKRIFYGHFPNRYNFDLSILTMPLDWNGSYLKGKKLDIPAKDFAIKVLLDLSNQLPELIEFCNDLLDNPVSNLYLLSNFANSGFTTFENEILLYEEVIRETAPPGSTVIIKNHPRGSDSVVYTLNQRLKMDYVVKIAENKIFNLFPIELWRPLMKNCNIFPIFSSSVISIKYFFSKQVNTPLNQDKINKFIFKNKVSETLRSESMCKKAVLALDKWDGQSPLWRSDSGHDS